MQVFHVALESSHEIVGVDFGVGGGVDSVGSVSGSELVLQTVEILAELAVAELAGVERVAEQLERYLSSLGLGIETYQPLWQVLIGPGKEFDLVGQQALGVVVEVAEGQLEAVLEEVVLGVVVAETVEVAVAVVVAA